MHLQLCWYAVAVDLGCMVDGAAANPQQQFQQIDGGVCADEDTAAEACNKLAQLLGRDAREQMATQYRALGGMTLGTTYCYKHILLVYHTVSYIPSRWTQVYESAHIRGVGALQRQAQCTGHDSNTHGR